MRAFLLTTLVAIGGCDAPATAPPTGTPEPSPRSSGLHEPYPYTTPTPPPDPTPVDGVYERHVGPDEAGGRGPCRRCPPYRLEEGDARLTLRGGVYLIENHVAEEGAIDWRSIGHFEVDGDTLTLFNDPNCPTTRGAYRWRLDAAALTLEAIDDDCAFGGLRVRYLTAIPWSVAADAPAP